MKLDLKRIKKEEGFSLKQFAEFVGIDYLLLISLKGKLKNGVPRVKSRLHEAYLKLKDLGYIID